MDEKTLLLPDKVQEAMETIGAIDSKPKLQLAFFVEHYLPMLVGKTPFGIERWLDVSRNAYNEVELVEGGVVVYTVPPLVERIPVSNNTESNNSVSEIALMASKKQLMSPKMGQDYLTRGVTQYLSTPIVDHTRVIEWNALLTRYGYDPIGLPEGVVVSKDTERANILGTDYEDL